MYSFLVVFQGLSKDENVVQVNYYDSVYYKVLKMSFIIVWNIVDMVVIPKNITRSLKRP